jgi:hypothetical protein
MSQPSPAPAVEQRVNSGAAPLAFALAELPLNDFREWVAKAHRRGRRVGVCGEASRNYPEIAQCPAEIGIDSFSLNLY